MPELAWPDGVDHAPEQLAMGVGLGRHVLRKGRVATRHSIVSSVVRFAN